MKKPMLALTAALKGEVALKNSFTDSRRALVEAAVQATTDTPSPAPLPEADVLKDLGVK